MADGVLYIFGGLEHSVLAAVSHRSLQRHWTGPVAMAVWDDAGESVASRLDGVEVIRFETIACDPQPRRGLIKPRWINRAKCANRALMCKLSPFERTICMDADTVVTGDIRPLLPHCGGDEVVFTTSTCGRPPEYMLAYERIEHEAREAECGSRRHWPTTSVSVMGFSRQSRAFFDEWLGRVRGTLLSNDLVVRSIYMRYPYVLLDDRFHRTPESPPWSPGDVRVWHFPGSRRYETEAAAKIWWPEMLDAIAENYGGVVELLPAMGRRFKRRLRRYRKYTTTTQYE